MCDVSHDAKLNLTMSHTPYECRTRYMSGTYPVTTGDRGRLVIPAKLRLKAELGEGTPVVLIDTPGGVVLVESS